MLYSLNGAYPATLPFQIFLSDGRCRTDPETFTQEELADAGFSGPFKPLTLGAGEVVVWDGEVLSKRSMTEEEIAARDAAQQPPVPASVTNFQARAALLRAGLFDQINDALMAKPVNSADRQAWEYANEVTRAGTLVNNLAEQLGLTSAQMDDLFRQAATIEA